MMIDVTDDFNRAAIGTILWTNGMATIVISASTVAKGGSAATDCSAWWKAHKFPSDHYAQIELRVDVDGGGINVRHQSGANTMYAFLSSGTQCQMYEITAGTFAALGSAYANNTVVGDVLKLAIAGSTLTPSLNGSALATQSDATITGGAPGISIFDTAMSCDNFKCGPAVIPLGAQISFAVKRASYW